jgi:chromosome segregation ATPase
MLVTERESSTDLLNESNKELAAAHNRIQKLTEELTAAHKRTKELTAEQSSAEMSSNNARTQLKSCQKDLAQAIASRDQSIKKLTNDIDAILAIEKESSAKFLKEANNRYEKALGDIQEKENVIKELSAAHEGLIKQKESLSKTILKQDKSLKELGKLLDDSREEVSLTSSHTLFESSTKFLKEANNRYEKALEDIKEKENVIKELKDAYESLVKQKESLSNAILQKDKSLKELGNRLDKAQFWQFL